MTERLAGRFLFVHASEISDFCFGDVDDGASVRRRQRVLRVKSRVGGQHCREGRFPARLSWSTV